MPLTKEEITKIIALIRTKDLANLRIAQQLYGNEVLVEVVEVVCDVFGIENWGGGMLRVHYFDDMAMEALLLLRSRVLWLGLYYNQLSTLPESIGQLVRLKRLLLNGNELMELPESIGQLVRLKELLLQGNELMELPESIGQLVRLKELLLDGNELMELPESIGQLVHLKELDLSANRLSTLPESIGQLVHLKMLYLAGNPIPTAEIARLRKKLRRCKIITGYTQIKPPTHEQKCYPLRNLFKKWR